MWKMNSPQLNFASADERFGLLGCPFHHFGKGGRDWVAVINIVDVIVVVVVVGASEKRRRALDKSLVAKS